MSDMVHLVELVAPLYLQDEDDASGLQLGDPGRGVSGVLVAVDALAGVVAEASALGADMVVCHHPLFYRPVRDLVGDTAAKRAVALAARLGVAVYAAHTSYDKAPGGMNDVLAGRLGLQRVAPFGAGEREQYLKLVVFVPEAYADVVREAIAAAGAGWIGNYSHCTFAVAGMGTFLPRAGADPFIGAQGRLERVAEHRLETILPAKLRETVVAALLRVHPYAEVAYDLYPLATAGRSLATGRVGELPEGMPLRQFVERVKEQLGLTGVRVTGDLDRLVQRVAVLGGAGADYVNAAQAAGADVYITGDVGYHTAREAEHSGMALIDAGHYGLERAFVPELAGQLRRLAAEHLYDVKVFEAQSESDPCDLR